MRRNPNTANLTKDFIESKLSQELIVSKYLGIDIEIIKDCIENNTLITSVFRDDDSNKSLGFQYNKRGKLKVRDFGGFGFFEDVYGTVAYVLSLVYNRTICTDNKQDFYFVLKHIAYTFSDIIDGKATDPMNDRAIQGALKKCRNNKPIIDLVTRSWNSDDSKIWSKWKVSLNYLNAHFVYPVDQYYINRTVDSDPKYYYSKKDPCYAYFLGISKNGIYNYKLYFPLRNRKTQLKFITNSNCLSGILDVELYNYDYIVITKSDKDRIALGSFLYNHVFYGGDTNKLNIAVVNIPSENYVLSKVEFEFLNSRLAPNGMVISLLDFDKTGRKGAKYLYDTYDIPYIFITRGEFGLENYGAKDFAELLEQYSESVIREFVEETIKYVELNYKDYES